MIKKVLALSILCVIGITAFAQSAKTVWVDSIYNALSPAERIGQLFMIPVPANITAETINEIENGIKSHAIGGLIFKDVGPLRQVQLANYFQLISPVPLLIAYEAGFTSLIDSTTIFPTPLQLGAIANDTLLYRLGWMMGRELKTLGVNIMFGPKTKIAAEPGESASFGEDKYRVTYKSLALMRGLQDNGILACATYFPLKSLHVLDVKHDLPVLEASVDSVQRFPYTTLIANGLKGVMPSPDGFRITYQDSSLLKYNYSPASLASLYTGSWIRKNLDFGGIAFVNLHTVGTLPENEKDGETELAAFLAGNDILMYPPQIAAGIRRIRKAVKKDEEFERQLEFSVKKILAAKFDAGLWESTQVSADNIVRKLNDPHIKLLNRELYTAAVTVLKNNDAVIPVHTLDNRRFAFIGGASDNRTHSFFEYLNRYVHHDYLSLEDKTDEHELLQSLSRYDVVYVGIYPETQPHTWQRIERIISRVPNKPSVVYCDFGNTEFLRYAEKLETVITAYGATPETFSAVPQIIYGGLPSSGILPFSVSKALPAGSGLTTAPLSRLAYSLPEDARMDSRVLATIDSIAIEAMRIRATPGCQIFVARKGKVVYEKTFGGLTYDNSAPVKTETIYDLASVTKVAATLQTAMFMHERGVIDLNRKVSSYLPELKKTNKKDITFMDMLTHQSGLLPFIPMYPQTMKDTAYLPLYYSRIRNEQYPLQVSNNLYASTVLRDSVWSWILKSKMTDKPVRTPYSYKYSDLGFLILQRVAETLLNQPLDEFVAQNLYEPLGAYSMGFNPLNRFSKQGIAPTEDDKIYRRTFVSGTVHDERAAMLGGVAGHAGLFSNANDLGKLGQMLLQQGEYGGIRYYKPETVQLFTARKFRNSRRGIGWDKPVQSDANSPTSLYASPSTFGHTGFTGTCMWVDPEFDLVYIFLSNRVYPDRSNKLSNANIRSRIQDVIYKSIFTYVEPEKPRFIVNDYAINAAASRPLE